MQEKIYVDRLFSGYENTPEIQDFKEEIVGNLRERIKELVSKGMDGGMAFSQATAELGDITSIADDMGKRKRNEVIGQMYIKTKTPLAKKTAVGLTIASGLLLLAVGLGLVAFFGETSRIGLSYVAATLLSVACGMYTYFGLTQETATHYAMKDGRALIYGVAVICACLGAGSAVVSFLFSGLEMSAALGVKMALLLPAACAFIFLRITENSRQKPWFKAMVDHEGAIHSEMVDEVKAAKFGVVSGGMWVLALAIFVALGFVVGWQYSWLTFLFALAIQIFMVSTIFERKQDRSSRPQELK